MINPFGSGSKISDEDMKQMEKRRKTDDYNIPRRNATQGRTKSRSIAQERMKDQTRVSRAMREINAENSASRNSQLRT